MHTYVHKWILYDIMYCGQFIIPENALLLSLKKSIALQNLFPFPFSLGHID